jgi:hypothetical protein
VYWKELQLVVDSELVGREVVLELELVVVGHKRMAADEEHRKIVLEVELKKKNLK